MLLMRLTSFWNNLTSFPVINPVGSVCVMKIKVSCRDQLVLGKTSLSRILPGRKNPWQKSFNVKQTEKMDKKQLL